jgi:hypothetical protein
MEYRILSAKWATLIRNFKDSEKEHEIEPRDSELLALAILDYIRWTRIRQWTLFTQKRGEEFEKLVQKLIASEVREDAIRRFVEDEERWKATLEMGEY